MVALIVIVAVFAFLFAFFRIISFFYLQIEREKIAQLIEERTRQNFAANIVAQNVIIDDLNDIHYIYLDEFLERFFPKTIKPDFDWKKEGF